ncbi:MAG TPA: hypothetical protein VEG65_02410 [Candidatus Bathyarchaeia archaeon]|nr:hypothetical protein [Candidatus Bathyarchaeia archaeon]
MRELEYVYEVAKNPLLAYTMLHTIDRFQHPLCIPPDILAKLGGAAAKGEKAHHSLTPPRFYRILFQIHKECEKKGLDLQLPYYWYKTGPVIYGRGAPRVFSVIRVKKTQQVAVAFNQWKDTILLFDGYESSYSDAVILTLNVDRLAHYSRLDLIYEYSPSQMHKVLVTILNQLQNATKKGALRERDLETLATSWFKLIHEDFEDGYSELYSSFERAWDLIQAALKSRSNAGRLSHIVEGAWNVFALGLRAKENAHIDQNQITRWKSTYARACTAFELELSVA